MILGFKEQFKESILNGRKIHTIREDKKERWKQGNMIHFATGIRTKGYEQFHYGICISVQRINIKHRSGGDVEIFIDNNKLDSEKMRKLALNDGFRNFLWFLKWFDSDFKGKIIHWTGYKY